MACPKSSIKGTVSLRALLQLLVSSSYLLFKTRRTRRNVDQIHFPLKSTTTPVYEFQHKKMSITQKWSWSMLSHSQTYCKCPSCRAMVFLSFWQNVSSSTVAQVHSRIYNPIITQTSIPPSTFPANSSNNRRVDHSGWGKTRKEKLTNNDPNPLRLHPLPAEQKNSLPISTISGPRLKKFSKYTLRTTSANPIDIRKLRPCQILPAPHVSRPLAERNQVACQGYLTTVAFGVESGDMDLGQLNANVRPALQV